MKPAVLSLLLAATLPAQAEAWVRDLVAKDPVTQEIARRHLAVTEDLPTAALVKLLDAEVQGTVLAAVTLLRDRKLELPALRKLAFHRFPAVREAVVPVMAHGDLRKTFLEGSPTLRVAALFEFENRELLTDDLLLQALKSDVAELGEAACQLVVNERSPFPVALASKLLDTKQPKLRLITFLADRPRNAAGPWLERILAAGQLTPMERILAINSLPSARIAGAFARQVLHAACSEDIAVSNRAAYAAARFLPHVADAMIPEIQKRVENGVPISRLLPCLERVSPAGENLILEYGLRGDAALRSALFHWLSSRESKLVDKYVARALDAERPFPKELIRLSGRILTTRERVEKIAAFLGGPERPAADAYSMLIEAKVYHPKMLEYAQAEDLVGKGRRLWRLLTLPLGKLPQSVFEDAFATDDLEACAYAVNSLARGPIPKKLERKILEFVESSLYPQLKISAARALILWGSESAGRKAWATTRKGQHANLAIRWLMQKPKPWCYEILLKERERVAKDTSKEGRVTLHRTLIALAKLGDRGANDALVRAIPQLAPEELRQVQKLMGRFLKKGDLQRLAAKYLKVNAGDPDETPDGELAEERRVELLEWFLARDGLDLTSILHAIWEKDGSYEMRLVALRGLLARGSAALYFKIYEALSKPYGDDQQELAFEIVGGGLGQPITDEGMELLAHIVLRAPLTAPRQEVEFALQQPHDSARGAYPVLTPTVNLLRRDETARPGAAFAKVATSIKKQRFALNRQRLGLFLAGVARRAELLHDVGPVVAKLLLEAPDLSKDFVGPAHMLLGEAAAQDGDFVGAAAYFARASRDFGRGIVPNHVRRAFLGVVDPAAQYHPFAALSARAPICRARALLREGEKAAARRELQRARDLAEGDVDTIREIADLLKKTGN